MITIINYGLGNIGSVFNMFKYLGFSVEVADCVEKIRNAEKLILPGVGSFDNGMNNLRNRHFDEILMEKVLIAKTPILGVCLGMQLLTDGSEEGRLPGFGWIPGYTRKFNIDSGLKIPHMGWNNIVVENENPLINGIDDESRYYFVHSFYVKCNSEINCIAKCHYGVDFDAIISNDNIYGTQFHPEKSHKFGMTIFRNFANL